jgi:hypothetical protein
MGLGLSLPLNLIGNSGRKLYLELLLMTGMGDQQRLERDAG